EKGELLITQRADSKKVWPSVWTNSVCGHPGPGEDMLDAIKRRLNYELGMTAKDFEIVLPTYRYRTPPYRGIVENEFCPVFFARASSMPIPNPEEVSSVRWMSWDSFLAATNSDSNDYSMFASAEALSPAVTGPTYSWWC